MTNKILYAYLILLCVGGVVAHVRDAKVQESDTYRPVVEITTLEKSPESDATPPLSEAESIKCYDIALSAELQRYTYDVCSYYNISEYYELILAVMQIESSFREDLISSTDDYGLMQINKCNHATLRKTLGITDIMDPYQNIHAGVYMLSGYLTKYNDITKALMCYNNGEYGAKERWARGVTSTNYSNKVLTVYKEYIDIL